MLLVIGSVLEALLSESGFIEVHAARRQDSVAVIKVRAVRLSLNGRHVGSNPIPLAAPSFTFWILESGFGIYRPNPPQNVTSPTQVSILPGQPTLTPFSSPRN